MRGLTVLLVIVLLGFVVFFALGYGARIIVSPWAWSLFRKHTLTGSWYGALHSDGGNDKAIFVEMHLPSRLRAGVNLTGSAKVCNSAGSETDYGIFGRTDGTNLSLKMVSNGSTQQRSMGVLDGRWSEETIDLKGSISSEPPKSNDWDPRLSGLLRKGTENDYRLICQKIVSSSK